MRMTTLDYEPKPEDFKDDTGRWRTKSLFIETNDDEDKYQSIFTLSERDKEGRVSMRSVYLSTNDPTEYVAAMQIFGSLDCWTRLCESPFFQVHLEHWRTEMQRQIKSKAVKIITDISKGGKTTNAQLSAAKWIASQRWVGPEIESIGRGRPTKQLDPVQALREGLANAEEEETDYERIFGTKKT